MGMDIYTRIMFGIEVGESMPTQIFAEDDDAEFDSFVLRVMDPDDSYAGDAEGWKRRKALIDAYPFDVVTLGSYDYPNHVLCFRDSIVCGSWRSGTTVVEPSHFAKTFHVDELQHFCSLYGIEYSEPKWLLGVIYSH